MSARPRPERERVLAPTRRLCAACGGAMRARYENRRTLVTLSGAVRLRLEIRRCEAAGCSRHHRPYRPEAEGAVALPQHEFGLDVVALAGALRRRGHRSVPEIHAALRGRGVETAERSVANLLDRHDGLLATSLTNGGRLRRVLRDQGRAVLALDGMRPDVGHEVLWVVRKCLSGEVVLARSLLSGRAGDLAPLLRGVAGAVGVPVVGAVSDGRTSIRHAVAQALPGVPHRLCQSHFLREAANPVFEADRHAEKEPKKQVRGVRPIERSVDGRDAAAAGVVRGYCAAVRSAITDDGRTPLAAPGLKPKGRLGAVADSLDRVAQKGASRRRPRGCTGWSVRGWSARRHCGRRWSAPTRGCTRRPGCWATRPARARRSCGAGSMGWPPPRRHRDKAGALAAAIDRFAKVFRSYRPGLFHSYDVPGLPRTDNGLERLFGSQRYHERRATGRRTASPAAVLRGEVRLIAATATRARPPAARELGRVSRERWTELRRRLEQRRHARTPRVRFRHDPDAYLAELEQRACQPTLPA